MLMCIFFFFLFDRLPSTSTKGFDNTFHMCPPVSWLPSSNDVLSEPASASLVKPKNAMGIATSDGRLLF